MEITICILVVMNCVASCIYCFKHFRNKRQLMPLLLLFLVFPLFGLLLYAIPVAMLRKKGTFGYDKEAYTFRLEVEQQEVMPSLQKELDLVPVRDAMAVSSNQKKRALLLDRLKQDIYTSYKEVLAANNDTDSESAHYVASAKMAVERQFLDELAKMQEEIAAAGEDATPIHDYLKKLVNYVNSGVLSLKEKGIYQREYCNLFERLLGIDSATNHTEVETYLTFLAELAQHEKAVAFWKQLDKQQATENMFFSMLKIYYELGTLEPFKETLLELEQSEVELSSEGLACLRFWRNRCYQ